MKLYTTLRRINACDPCSDGLEDLFKHIGQDYPASRKIYFADVLRDGVDFGYIIWGLKTVPKNQKGYMEKAVRVFACDCAARVLPIFEKRYPSDKRPREAIETTRKWIRGEVDAAAGAAAGAAAWAAARAAAWAATRDATWDATRAAERKWQIDRFIQYLNGEVDFMQAEGRE